MLRGWTRPSTGRPIITVSLTADTPATWRLTWRTDARARCKLEDEIFGKRIRFTGHDEWPVVDVVAAYRAEPDSRLVPTDERLHVVSFSPMHHWTDQRIRVHAFYSVLALQIAHLARRHAHQAAFDLSVCSLLAELARIQQTVLLYQADCGRPCARLMLTDMCSTQQRRFDLFDRYAPRR